MPMGDDGPDDDDEAQEEAATAPEGADHVNGGDDDDIDHESEEEHERQRPLCDPGQPTPAEIAEHDLSHIPFRPWCADCVHGKAKDKQSRRLCGSYSESHVPRVRLDYCFLTEP